MNQNFTRIFRKRVSSFCYNYCGAEEKYRVR